MRGASALVLLGGVLTVTAGCNSDAPSARGPLQTVRLGSSSARGSTGNVSRPLAEAATWPLVQDGTQVRVRLELAPWPDDRSRPRLIARRRGRSVDLALQQLPPREAAPFAWHAFAASLEALEAGAWELGFEADGLGDGRLLSQPRVLSSAEGPGRLNVLCIVLDTVRADYLGCYGHDTNTSPRMDAWARGAVLFERAISPASWTLPAMTSLLTGLFSESHGIVQTHLRIPDEYLSFFERLAEAGHATGGVVTGTFTDSYWGMDQGFDAYDDLGMVVDDAETIRGAPERLEAMDERAHRRVTSGEATDRACRWLEEHRGERFALLAHYFDPHSDYIEHEGHAGFPPRGPDAQPFGPADPDPATTARLRARYESEIAFTDHHVGRLLDQLEALGLTSTTVVVVTADHGEEFYERQWLGHGNSLFNELLRVPLLLAVPGVPARRVAHPVSTVHLGATLLDYCGLGDQHGQGVSLRPWMEGAGEPLPVYAALYPSVAAAGAEDMPLVRLGFRVDLGDQTLIRDTRVPDLEPFLYRGHGDPLQTRNQAPLQGEAVRTLQGLYDRAAASWLTPAGAGIPLNLSEDLQETLQALGYLPEN